MIGRHAIRYTPLSDRRLIDADLAAYVEDLGIDGIVDIHTHFMPDAVQHKVWDFFESGRGGRRWDVRYKAPVAERAGLLATLGVERYTALAYAHRPGMAEWLNEWTLAFAERTPACVPSATFYPEPSASTYVAAAINRGVGVFKVHLVVGAFDPWHPDLRDVWDQIERAGVSVVIHAGAYPTPTPWTGAGGIETVLGAHPDLRLVIAHMGTPDSGELLDLCVPYPQIRWDTTMVLTRFWENEEPLPERVLGFIAEHPERLVFGSDFPTIPHAYAHQVDVLRRLGHGDDWMRMVLATSGWDAITPRPR